MYSEAKLLVILKVLCGFDGTDPNWNAESLLKGKNGDFLWRKPLKTSDPQT